MLEIDGSIGEGGGQVLRTALSLSCVLGKPVRIANIRAGRSQPGLKPQHLAVCNALAGICKAKMDGARIGSTQLEFKPGEARGGEFEFDIGTAGSCTLLLQALLPVLLCAREKSAVIVRGGTHVRAAPTFEYFSEVFLPAISLLGANASAKMKRAGFYPAGGGEVELLCGPCPLVGAEFKEQDREEVGYSIVSSRLPSHVSKREEETVRFAFPSAKGGMIDLPASCPGNALTLWSGLCGASALGERGKKAEEVAKEACDTLAAEMRTRDALAGESGKGNALEGGGGVLEGGAWQAQGHQALGRVDSHLADQLLIYAALAKGKTAYKTSKFTPHLETNAKVLGQMTGRNIMLNAECSSIEVI